MLTPKVLSIAVALVLAGCGAKTIGPPEIVADRTPCSHCGMFVSEPTYASAYQVHGQQPRVFDDIGCMLDAVRHETASPIAVWVQDAGGAGWLAAADATFVAAPAFRTPMGGGVLAYGDRAPAQQAAATHGGEVVGSFEQLTTRKGDAR